MEIGEADIPRIMDAPAEMDDPRRRGYNLRHKLIECLQGWLSGDGVAGGREVNIDGKTLRGTATDGGKAINMVSAWVNSGNMTLGQVETDGPGNEITAIPRLLDMLNMEGDTVTIDASDQGPQDAKPR